MDLFDALQGGVYAAAAIATLWVILGGKVIPKRHYRQVMVDRDKWRHVAEVTEKSLAELADTGRAGVVIPKGMAVKHHPGGPLEVMLDMDGTAYLGRKDWTKDVPGDYSPLPPETVDQMQARWERQALKDWTDQWEKLTGEPWESDEERDARRAAAAKESETISMRQAETALVLAAHKFSASLNTALGRGGIIRDGTGLPAGLDKDGVHPQPKYRVTPKDEIPPSTKRAWY